MYTVFNLINLDKLTKWFYINDQFSYLGFSAYLLLGYCLFVIIFTLIAHKFTTKLVAIILIVISTFVSYFILKYNIAFDTSMLLNTIYTNSSEVFPLASTQMIPYIIFLLFIPIIAILKVNIIYNNKFLHILKALAIIVFTFLIALASIYSSFKELHRAGNLSNKYILYSLVPLNYLTATIDVIKKNIILPLMGDEIGKDKKIVATITKKDDLVVVLAIGEGIRQKNLNLYGYTRNNTTPLLSQVDGLYSLNGIARLGSTLYALKEILRKDDVKLTHITDSVGIDTKCYVNFSMYDNCSVGETHAKPNKKNETYDEEVIPMLKKNIDTYKDSYRFIALHLGAGAHGPVYSNRYPKSFQKFMPMCTDPDILHQCSEEERYNAYDNAMLYQDYTINKILKTLEDSSIPYVFIFISDHGESLGENGYVFHGMPPGMTLPKEQAEVALLVKSSIPIKIVKREKYTQPDIFDTILDLFSIQIDGFNKDGSFIKKL
ncbi:phosphoethanolamine transferase domain-containing protein [Arcobacteraceae bacterium]|nr:phosphoethanolamine transferase domain-containing protein [Arcobacteraceae bacterium]